MYFASDNSGPAHPRVIEAIARANEGYAMPYGAETAMARVRDRLRDIADAPKAAVYLVATGTAVNSLLLAVMTRPWQTIYCSEVAHVEEDECGAPSFFSGGARLTPVPAPNAMMTPELLRERIENTAQGFVHGVQRGPVSVTSVTERGTVYPVERLGALTEVAREHGLCTHLDGARLANAVDALGCAPHELLQGFDAISFGGTKNGLMGVEAAIIRDPDLAWEFELRRKRAGHLFSKHRYLSAQMEAYLQDDLWLELAQASNAAAARLVEGLRGLRDVDIVYPADANMVYCMFPRVAHQRLLAAGAQFYPMGPMEGPPDEPVRARLVCDWSATEENTDRFLEILGG